MMLLVGARGSSNTLTVRCESMYTPVQPLAIFGVLICASLSSGHHDFTSSGAASACERSAGARRPWRRQWRRRDQAASFVPNFLPVSLVDSHTHTRSAGCWVAVMPVRARYLNARGVSSTDRELRRAPGAHTTFAVVQVAAAEPGAAAAATAARRARPARVCLGGRCQARGRP